MNRDATFACHSRARALSLFLAAAPTLLAAAACSGAGRGDDAGGTSASALTFAPAAEKDLAVVFALDSSAPIKAADGASAGALLPSGWYTTVSRAFDATSAAGALQGESRYEDWQVVSFRVAPCAALGKTPSSDIERICWPEVRIVWQPVVRNVRVHERFATHFADDRALHALYDAPAEAGLPAGDAARARAYLQRIRTVTAGWRGGAYAPLPASDLADFQSLRDRVAAALVDGAVALRDGRQPVSAYRGLDLRPESVGSPAEQGAFRARVLTFFDTYARPAALKTLTAFSLPEGREPANTTDWVFLSFHGTNGSIDPEPIVVTSARDGRELFRFPAEEHGSMGGDDPLLDEASRDASVSPEIRESVILSNPDVARLTPVLRDRRARLVPNTGCASCHATNPLRFDFHNLGYLEDRELNVSPRVVTDIALDLAWLEAGRAR